MAAKDTPAPVHAVVENHPGCPSHLPVGINDLDGHLLACHATKQEATAIAEHLDLSGADDVTPDSTGGPMAKKQPTYGVQSNHPDCPDDMPHATVNNKTGEVLKCHGVKQEAQDLALTLNIPDVGVIPASAAADTETLPVVVEVPVLAEWKDVELVAAGEWDLSTGTASFTTADLQSAVGAAECPAVGRPILKIGHADPRFTPNPAEDGEPAIGWVAGMRLNESMTKIVGDFAGMPGWLGEILPSAYPERSVEGAWNFPCQLGHTHPFVITAVALLGCTPPGVGIIASLNDVATLYGIEAAAPADDDRAAPVPFTLTLGDAMPPAGSAVIAAGTNTTIDDVRRSFYETADWSQWIIELQLDPLALIVSDDSNGDLLRVPIELDPKTPGGVGFGAAETVLVQYIAAPTQKADAAKGGPDRMVAAVWATRAQSRGRDYAAAWAASTQLSNLGDDPSSTQLKALFALPGDTKSDSKLPHHNVASDGTVGAANADGCSAAIGAINGAQGGLADVSADDKKAAYNHLAAHLTAAGQDPPEFKAATGDSGGDSAGDDLVECPTCDGTGKVDGKECTTCDGTGKVTPAVAKEAADTSTTNASGTRLEDGQVVAGAGIDVDAAGAHGTYDGEHSHPHSAYGAQGGDETHDHMHRHSGDAVHQHVHNPMSAAPPQSAAPPLKGAPEVEFTTEQLAQIREKLGKPADHEVTAADIAAAFAAPPAPIAAAAAAAAGGEDAGELPTISDGTYLVDGEILRDYQSRAAAGDHAAKQLRVNERDQVLAEALRVGKFSRARLPHYQAMWDGDPEGARKHVDALAAGLVPMAGAIGQPGTDPDLPGDFEEQQAYRKLYPEDLTGGRRG
jgi:hypothetical protein